MQALAQSKTQLVPQIIVNGGEGSQGGTLVDVLLANLIRDNMKLGTTAPVVPPAEQK